MKEVAMYARRLFVVLLLSVAAAAATLVEPRTAATPAAAAASACSANAVHYERNRDARPGLTQLPWIAGGRGRQRIVGYLFYYPLVLADGRANRQSGVVIPTGERASDGGSTKILWVPRGQSALTMVVTGRRLDGTGAFRQRLRAVSGGAYPSVVDVPQAGCWELTLTSGKAHAKVVLQAVDPAPAATCDATPIHGEPNAALLDAPWIETVGATRPIYAIGSIHDGGPTSEGASVFTGGRKVMWVPSVPESEGSSLTVMGHRLDAVGAFRQQFPRAFASTPPSGPVFPSRIDVPTPGCWLLTVREGNAAGIAVFRAVEPLPSG